MIDQKLFLECIVNEGVEFITGVPDTLLNDFCLNIVDKWPEDHHVIAANEGNAIALAAGYQLSTGTIPLVYMQNSGLGNIVNPVISLVHKDVYNIPMVLLIGWRGDPNVSDHIQHTKQGVLTPVLLEAMDIPYMIMENDTNDAIEKMGKAIRTAKELNSIVALIVKKGVLEKGEKAGFNDEATSLMSREEAIKSVIELLPGDTIFVASTGRATRELHEIRSMTNVSHDRDFLNVGAMGHTSSIATGMALGSKDQLVVCLEGDGSAIMHLGAFTTIAVVKPDNFLHIVLNNGVHESVGGQPTAGKKVNLTKIAESSGYNTIGIAISNKSELEAAFKKLLTKKGSSFVEVEIRKGIRSDLPPLKFNLLDSKEKLIKTLQSDNYIHLY